MVNSKEDDRFELGVKGLNYKSDQHLISPHSISTDHSLRS